MIHPPLTTRAHLTDLILERFREERELLVQSWQENDIPFRHLIIDTLLPGSSAQEIHEAFPAPEAMVLRWGLRERKRIAFQMDRCKPLLSEIIYAFQDRRLVQFLSEVTGLASLEPDPTLYAAGVSLMRRGDFLAPHVDNSHDADRRKYRVLNLLYYVSPGWRFEDGGNLELWDQKVRHPKTIPASFNRLILIETHTDSWHSVSRVTSDTTRCCVSNYYFSENSPIGRDYFQITRFTGWPKERWRCAMLRVDGILRMGIRRIFPEGLFPTRHIYRKGGEGNQ